MSDFQNSFSSWDPKFSNNTDEVTERLASSKDGLPQAILKYQQAKAKEILSCCIQPGAIAGTKNVGLVVGKVQSGKTTSFTYLSSLAADNGYKIIIHLLGTTKNLVKSNADAVNTILAASNSSNHWLSMEFDSKFESDFPCKTMEETLYPRDNELDFFGQKSEKVVYMYLIKNHKMIDRLTAYLNEFHFNLDDGRSPLPTLIIDDEVDSFSQDVGEGDSATSLVDAMSSTHESLQNLYDACSIGTYVGYTATAAAVANANPDNELNPDFLCTLDPGPHYDGNKELFGDKLYRRNPEAPNPKYIKTIPEFISKDEDGNELIDERQRNNSLNEAFRYWLVSSLIASARGKLCGDSSVEGSNCSTFLVHPGTDQDSHTEMHRVVLSIQEAIKDSLAEDDEQENNNNADLLFKDIYESLINPEIDSILFSSVITQLKAIINKPSVIGIRVLNADSRQGRDSIPDIRYRDHPLWVVIGGTGLSRGYVVKGLVTTWMPRLAERITGDTLEQTGRFFGYHKGYKDLIRIFLRYRSIEAFKAYQFYETSLLAAVNTCIQDEVRLSDSTFSLILPSELEYDTSPLKSKRDYSLTSFIWAQSEYCPFQIIDSDSLSEPLKNNSFYEILESCISSLENHGKLMPAAEEHYSQWYSDYTKLQTHPSSVYKVASDLPVKDIFPILLEPLSHIKNLDENLKLQISSMKEKLESNIVCDLIQIKHPGPGGGQSFRGVIKEAAKDEEDFDKYRVGGIQQGGGAPRSPAGFKGDAHVTISEETTQSKYPVLIHYNMMDPF